MSPTDGNSPQEVIEWHNSHVACAFFDEEVNINDIPSQYICPLTCKPPMFCVYFDVPNVDGSISKQVFEQSELLH